MPDDAPVTMMVFSRMRTGATVQSPAVPEPALTVESASTVTAELVDALGSLIPQLSRSSPPPGAAELAEMLAAPGTTVFVTRLGEAIVGTLTLIVFRIPTGLRAWIEDVVVDDSARGHGAGELLTRAALDHAAALGVKTVDLTSRPSREAANRLYQRLGFEVRETNLYRYTVER
ncbi:MAG: hypothetical protein NVSMB12_11530 [Acidimicrobiales bacterium]